jgi:hypothetical protein
MRTPTAEVPGALVDRLCRAVNEHDVEALTSCFAAVPDIVAEVRWITDQETVWSEWEMRGTRQDGSPHLMRGVVIFGVDRGEATWARFYLEPVQEGGEDADEAIRRAIVASSNTDPASAHNLSELER